MNMIYIYIYMNMIYIYILAWQVGHTRVHQVDASSRSKADEVSLDTPDAWFVNRIAWSADFLIVWYGNLFIPGWW